MSLPPPVPLPACPFLPPIDAGAELDWRLLNTLGSDRGARFYERCLMYAQFLWIRGQAARAILAADRALLADLAGDEPILRRQPLPYRPLAWMISHAPPGVFIGNPRVHYQHLADRVREPRRAQRSARAWACWHLARAVLPGLPGDPRHAVREPTREDTARALEQHGIAGECAAWTQALQAVETPAATEVARETRPRP